MFIAPVRSSNSGSVTYSDAPINVPTQDTYFIKDMFRMAQERETGNLSVTMNRHDGEDVLSTGPQVRGSDDNVFQQGVPEASYERGSGSYFPYLPIELVLQICGLFVDPRDVLNLSCTCRALQRALSSESSNFLWYSFLTHKHTQREQAAVKEYKSWPRESIECLSRVLTMAEIAPEISAGPTNTPRSKIIAPEDFFHQEPKKYCPRTDYRQRCLGNLSWEWHMGSRRCTRCLMPAGSKLFECMVFTFPMRWKGVWRREGVRFCMDCVLPRLIGDHSRLCSMLDLSMYPIILWPRAVPLLSYWNPKPYRIPDDRVSKAIEERSMMTIYCEPSLKGGMYFISHIKEAAQKQFGVTVDEYSPIGELQVILFQRLSTEIIRRYRETERGYKFERCGVLGEDRANDYLQSEWGRHKCLWGLPEDCMAARLREKRRALRRDPSNDDAGKTGENISEINIFDAIPNPPTSTNVDSQNVATWISSSANLMVEKFFADPIIPLTPETKNDNFAKNKIWAHGSSRFFKRDAGMAGMCFYCKDKTYRTPYYYSFHLFTKHKQTFYSSKWRWRLELGTNLPVTKQVVPESALPPKLKDRQDVLNTRQYGPYCQYVPRQGIYPLRVGYYYLVEMCDAMRARNKRKWLDFSRHECSHCVLLQE